MQNLKRIYDNKPRHIIKNAILKHFTNMSVYKVRSLLLTRPLVSLKC